MFFGKKEPPKTPGSTPPWANIDEIPKIRRDTSRIRLNILEVTRAATGFGPWGARFLLLFFSAGVIFIAYVYYVTSHQPPAPPRDFGRPAMDAKASSTRL